MNSTTIDAAHAAATSQKRKRRTKAESQELLNTIKELLANQSHPAPIRNLFYRLAGIGAIQKTEGAYQNLIQFLVKHRRGGEIPFNAFVDGTRYYSGSALHDDAQSALENCAASYRRNLWASQRFEVEIWVEKDAVRGLVERATRPYGVRCFAARGFASLTSLHAAACAFIDTIQRGKIPIVFYLGDYDESGLNIDAAIRKEMLFHGADLHFERIAIDEWQIGAYDLPTRPPKGKGRMTRCVEIDSMPAETIIQIVQEKIEGLIDRDEWERWKAVEAAEKETLLNMADDFYLASYVKLEGEQTE